MDPVDRYIEYCWQHNTEPAADKRYHIHKEAWGYKTALEDLGYRADYRFAADMHFIDLGIKRPMCCGMLLDIEDKGVLTRPENQAAA